MSFLKTEQTPILIAGPCSAESRSQIFSIAESLTHSSVSLLRAGVWKPRSRPGNFEGNGEEALGWLSEAKKQYGLPFAVEVAEPKHVSLALAFGADAVWIGARTTVNPFHVQQLADAIKGAKIPVLVKNPVTPDVDLWVGAIERFERAGIAEVLAVHRGFTSYQSGSKYRNPPNWVVPIELKRRRPDKKIICDPSHISGNRVLVAEVSQKAMDMGFDGLMIEVHPDPDAAWSDAAQQITPDTFAALLKGLVIRNASTTDMTASDELEYLRALTDGVDAEIIELLARRMELSERMGKLKKRCNMPVYNPERWAEIVESRSHQAQNQNLSPDFILNLYEKIHHESVRRQLDILESKDNLPKD
ncbi:MAG: bifunctional 3-deoxy-7-phosphoheptulonate synthase/chorismate mutase type II [Bacteroidetes bacterium]|nr:bifunctional 3-deoxy-7-phosphoheptulonate synthase/chorismate mutase type II [Bacteroidota bacterium]